MRLLEDTGRVRLRVAAIGDVGVIGSARRRARKEGFDAPFRSVAPILATAELGFANLEMPIGAPEWVRPGRSPEFWHDAEVAAALAGAGVRVVSLANNHIADCGPRGIARTREVCGAAGLEVAGAGANLEEARRPAHLEIRGQRVTVLAYAAPSSDDCASSSSPGLAPLSLALMREDIAHWRPRSDILIVSAHWASMYVDYPPPRVLELARALADSGVDLVLGHHPHVTQGFRRYDRTLVLFSLGDIVFDSRAGFFKASTGAEERLRTGVFIVSLGDQAGLDYHPLLLDADGIPVPADDAEAVRQRTRLERISDGLQAGAERFHRESASQLMRYELETIGHHLRAGRLDLIVRLLGTIRPRHLALIWNAVRRMRRSV